MALNCQPLSLEEEHPEKKIAMSTNILLLKTLDKFLGSPFSVTVT